MCSNSVLLMKCKAFSLGRQCDQMAKLFFNVWPFTTIKICPKSQKFANVALKFCKGQNKPSSNCHGLLFFSQSGKISPNLVALSVGDTASTWQKIERKIEVQKSVFSFVKHYSLWRPLMASFIFTVYKSQVPECSTIKVANDRIRNPDSVVSEAITWSTVPQPLPR